MSDFLSIFVRICEAIMSNKENSFNMIDLLFRFGAFENPFRVKCHAYAICDDQVYSR